MTVMMKAATIATAIATTRLIRNSKDETDGSLDGSRRGVGKNATLSTTLSLGRGGGTAAPLST
jgi:hypothetical protein